MEILDIEYNQQQLMIKALNKYGNNEDAAKALGITGRTLSRWKKKFKVTITKIKSTYEGHG